MDINKFKSSGSSQAFSDDTKQLKVTYSSPQRWIIDFNDMSIEEAICYQLPFRYVKATVKPQRDKTQDIEAIKYWWKYWRSR